MAGISSPGIGSGLDVNGIIAKLMQAESAGPTQVLNTKQASYQSKLSALGVLSGALSAFQVAIGGLNDPSIFQSTNATSSDTTIFSASSSPTAAAGNYNITVNQLAQSQTISSAGQASTSATIGSGTSTTLTFEFGSITGGKLQNGQYVNDPTATPPNPTFTQDANQVSGTVTIDSANNSLQGIRDAINNAKLGVTASIVSDGSANPYHLVITSNSTGATSSMKITSSGGDPALGSLLGYDPAGTQNMTQTAAAQNASLSINGMAISSATNQVTQAIDGVTLTATKVGTASLSVTQNSSAVQSNVNAFVKAYNDVNATIKKLTAFDKDSSKSGALIGDSSVQMIQSQLRKMMSTPLTGSSGSLTLLSQAGISIDKDGIMSVDSGKLSAAMSSNMNDVTALFSTIGSTSDSLVSYVSSTSNTPPGTNQVNITTLATQGTLVGSAVVGANTAINALNKDLTVTINGVSASVSLLTGSYTPQQLAAQVQSAINGTSAFSSAGIAVNATIDGAGELNITSTKFGSSSTIAVTGNGASTLLGASPVATAGVDVAGTIGGVAATGSGQFLTGASGSPASGLKLKITGQNIGNRGAVTFSQGYAFNLSNMIDSFTGSNGMLPNRTSGIKSSLDDISTQRDALSTRLTALEARYRAQFTALDVMMSKMNSTSNFLAQQLDQLSNLTKQSNK